MKIARLRVRGLLLLTLLVAAFFRFYRLWELPPGLFFDEAFNGLDALRVLRAGYLTPFFPENNGREALFIYLQSAAIAIWGINPWVLRIVPVLVGIATVPLVYLLGRSFFAGEKRGQYVGLAAAAALSVVYWHVSFSRLGFRAILLPATSTIVFLYFWRGCRSGRRRDFVWAGLALGLSLYTYLSARLLPFILIAFVAILVALEWFQHRRGLGFDPSMEARRAVTGLALTLAFGALVAIPLLGYFYLHPEDLVSRGSVVLVTPERNALRGGRANATEAQLIFDNTVTVARMFVDQGDLNARHNLPGRPALDPLLLLGFLVALGAGIFRFRSQPVYVLLLIWLVSMLATSALTFEAPHFLRMIGALPPLMVLAADGLTRLRARFVPQLDPSLLVLLILLVGGLGTFRDYFQVWADLPQVHQGAFDGAANSVTARAIQESAGSDVLLPVRLYESAVYRFLLAADFPAERTLAGNFALDKPLVILTSGGAEDKQYVLLQRDPKGMGTIYYPEVMAGLPALGSRPRQPILDSRGVRVGNRFSLDELSKSLIHAPQPAYPLEVNFGDLFQLRGYTIDKTEIQPGETVSLELYWQAAHDMDRGYSLFVHLLDSNDDLRAEWSAQRNPSYAVPGLWKEGTLIPVVYRVAIPADASPVKLRFEIGWLSGEDRMPVLDAQGREVDDRLIFGQVTVGTRTNPTGTMQMATSDRRMAKLEVR